MDRMLGYGDGYPPFSLCHADVGASEAIWQLLAARRASSYDARESSFRGRGAGAANSKQGEGAGWRETTGGAEARWRSTFSAGHQCIAWDGEVLVTAGHLPYLPTLAHTDVCTSTM